MVENMIRLRQERETAAREEREKRAKNAEDDAYMKAKKAARDAVAHEMKKQDYDIKGAMAMQTYATMHVETQKQIDRAQRGEKERMFTERSRQEHVAERERFKQADKDEEKKLFRMDEAARAEYRAGKQAKKQLRRKQGTDRMKQQEEERKALEKMEADRQDADKRAFRAKTRAKAAEKEVLKEHGLRAEEERQANNAEFDAQRAIRDMKVAHEREVDAETVLSEVVVHSKPRNVSPSRTEYEVREAARADAPDPQSPRPARGRLAPDHHGPDAHGPDGHGSDPHVASAAHRRACASCTARPAAPTRLTAPRRSRSSTTDRAKPSRRLPGLVCDGPGWHASLLSCACRGCAVVRRRRVVITAGR